VSRQYHENAAEILTELLARGTQLEHLGRRARAVADHARSHVPFLIALLPLPVKVSRQARSGSSGPLSLRGGLAMEQQGPAPRLARPLCGGRSARNEPGFHTLVSAVL
jgi:hypothetical protein